MYQPPPPTATTGGHGALPPERTPLGPVVGRRSTLAGHGALELLGHVVGIDPFHGETLRAAARSRHQVHRRYLDLEQLGQQPLARLVRPTAFGCGRHPHLQRVTMASDDFRTAGAGLDVEAEHRPAVAVEVEQLALHTGRGYRRVLVPGVTGEAARRRRDRAGRVLR